MAVWRKFCPTSFSIYPIITMTASVLTTSTLFPSLRERTSSTPT